MKTDRLILRRWRESDLAPFAAMNADPVVMEYYPACLDANESRDFIARVERKFETQGFGLWAATLKESGAFIGYIGLNVPTFDTAFTPCVEIGWRLSRDQWGNGYATEGARACLDFAVTTANLGEVLSWTFAGNMRSRRVMERIGMKRDITRDFEHPDLPPGDRLRPHVLYRVQRS
jgi:ribosomal-protein-alanine N-acetyltransferase